MKKIFLLWLLSVSSCPAVAETVTLPLPNGLVANAAFVASNKSDTAIVLLHGFQSTYRYGTVQALSNKLQAKGYTLLTPNLTLGINNRNEPYACDAPHNSSLTDEGAEVLAWVHWLKHKGYRKIIAIGHSSGSTSLLAAFDGQKPIIQQLILTSAYGFDGPNATISARDQQLAQRNLGTDNLAHYTLAICQGNYAATGRNYLSFAHWHKERVIEAINRSQIPITVIMPGNDNRLQGSNQHWLHTLQESRAKLIVIPNADHFFSHNASVALMDTIQQTINHDTITP